MLRADLHVHTAFSPDCLVAPQKVVARCLKTGITCLAITDHNTIEGAVAVRRLAPFPVIVGEEVMTEAGEIIGLFLQEPIPGRLPLAEAIKRIRAQEALVVVPHPLDRCRRRSSLGAQELEGLLDRVDALEVFNARTLFRADSERVRFLAQKRGLLQSAGSDAHTLAEIGRAYVELPEFEGMEGFRQALAQGKVFGRPSGLCVHLWSIGARIRKRL